MYDMVMRVVEKPLLEVVMKHAEGNQSRAAEWLGINRNTLRAQAAVRADKPRSTSKHSP